MATVKIKKGIYKFYDDLSSPTFDSSAVYALPFSVKPKFIITDNSVVIVKGAVDFNAISYGTSGSEVIAMTYEAVDDYYTQSLYAFKEGSAKWNVIASILEARGVNDAELLKGWGQILTVTEDTEFTDENGIAFANWFINNTRMLVTVTYNGVDIATLSEGQTATIKCKEKVMKDDIVITL